MAYYTGAGTYDLSAYNNTGTSQTALLVVDAGTGSLSLEVLAGEAWIVQEAFTADTVKRVFVGGGTWRAVLAGNAAFEWSV
tara:strand:+ start:2198 stop:2440 length:243 start_codon:yes stop_codon:yes gene_type:complete